jgi:hypothetical protein
MKRYTVLLADKYSNQTASLGVMAANEEEAMDKAGQLINTDPSYAQYKEGWRITEALEA